MIRPVAIRMLQVRSRPRGASHSDLAHRHLIPLQEE